MKTYRNLSTLIVLTGALILPIAPSARAEDKKPADEKKAQLMFVQMADDLKADGQTLRLVNVGQQTLYFSDRPVRIAGHVPMADYMKEWTAAAGAGNFAADPPNATLSVYEPGSKENKLVVIKISQPVIDGKDLVYNYKLIEGTMPKAGGATSLFIDWIGAGGGVGVGFHGVGVGGRGVGWRQSVSANSTVIGAGRICQGCGLRLSRMLSLT